MKSFLKNISGSSDLVKKSIPDGLSLYLELIRFLAAASVVLYHTWSSLNANVGMNFPGHEAVVVFFVLSGYVIAHAASRPGVTLAIYVQHRIARIVPAAWLALLLAVALAITLPELSKGAELLAPTLVNMFFIGHSGWGSIEPPLNPAFWSLNYEVWYYVIFAAWLFAPRHRWLWCGTIAVLAGPKILMLLPIWLMGVCVYHRMPKLHVAAAFLIFAATTLIATAMWWFDVSDHWRYWLYKTVPFSWRAYHSTQFLYDIVLGVVVAANFVSVASLNVIFGKLSVFERAIRYLASFTFSLYVFHMPLTELLLKVWKLDRPLQFYLVMAVCVFLLAQLTERRTGWYRHRVGLIWKAKGLRWFDRLPAR